MYDVIITTKEEKEKIIQKKSDEKIFHKEKIYTVEEIEELYFGKLNPLSLYETVKEFHLHPKVASLYLSYLYDVPDFETNNEKINVLQKIKKHLEEKGYLQKNKIFDNFFQNKKILVYHIPFIKRFEKIKKQLENVNDVTIEEMEIKKRVLTVSSYETLEEEVVGVASKITDLIEQNVDINHIKIYTSTGDYGEVIFRIFTLFEIPYEEEKIPLKSFPITIEFLSLLEKNSLEKALEKIENQKENPIYEKIYNIILPYLHLEDSFSKKVISYQISNTSVSLHHYENVVKFVTLNDVIEEEDYLFVLGMNQDYFPKTYKDDELFSDEEKSLLEIETSYDKNIIEKEKTLQKIYQTKNIFLSYKLFASTQYIKSSLIEEEQMKEITPKYNYTNHKYNCYLRSKAFDHYLKYKEKNEDFEILRPLKNSLYLSYDSSYKKIDVSLYHQYMKNYIRLSYSTLTTFFKCPFRFYVSKILKIYNNKTSVSLDVGNIVHNILCKVLKQDDMEDVIDQEIDQIVTEKNNKNCFYKEKWKKEILDLISIIHKQNENTDFKNTYLEDLFEIPFERKMLMILEGKIDKVMTYEKDENCYVMVIDYKTGTIDTDFNPILYGLNMQLMIYYYLLLKNIENIKPAGFYYQNIMKNLMNREDGKTYEEMKQETYRLEGYTVQDLILLPHIVKDIDHSFIKGLKLKKDDTFSHTSKVLDEQKIEKLKDLTEENIKKAMDEIENAEFSIAPKRMENELAKDAVGCKYCPYQDICYRKNKDFIYLKKCEKLSFLDGGDL